VLGFLFYNWSPARIFMGDSGSYFLGYVLSTTALVTTNQKASTAVSLVVPVLALGLPIFDTLFAMVRRILERRSVFSPDRGHIHHRLLDMGLTHRRAVMILYGASLLFTAAAIGVSLGRAWQVGVALFVASATLVGLVRFVGYYDYLVRSVWQRMRIRPRDAEVLRRLVPRLPLRLDEARTEGEVMRELWRFADEADLDVVELLGEGDQPLASWSRTGSLAPASGRANVTATYPLGRDDVAHAWVRFGWTSDSGDVHPQCDILLQVAADILTLSLARSKSHLAPASSYVDAADEPAALAASSGLQVRVRESQV
jgi:UDP-GlcNAc:undecaprenyl-phosphate GlcNAc-1-phosphate transferase